MRSVSPLIRIGLIVLAEEIKTIIQATLEQTEVATNAAIVQKTLDRLERELQENNERYTRILFGDERERGYQQRFDDIERDIETIRHSIEDHLKAQEKMQEVRAGRIWDLTLGGLTKVIGLIIAGICGALLLKYTGK